MKLKERIEIAEAYFKRNGYALGFTSPRRGVDLIVFPKGAEGKGPAVFVACMETTKYFHLQPFGVTKTRKTRFQSLVNGAKAWIAEAGWNGKVRFDAITINREGNLDHMENAGYAEGMPTVGHSVIGGMTITSEH